MLMTITITITTIKDDNDVSQVPGPSCGFNIFPLSFDDSGDNYDDDDK